jgi:hypothetical protein
MRATHSLSDILIRNGKGGRWVRSYAVVDVRLGAC